LSYSKGKKTQQESIYLCCSPNLCALDSFPLSVQRASWRLRSPRHCRATKGPRAKSQLGQFMNEGKMVCYFALKKNQKPCFLTRMHDVLGVFALRSSVSWLNRSIGL